ncbi:putative phage tail protein [Polaromonas sp. UC242_47]|uniref:putative phage tail protein n=1 Tax=Polaromonas sp. UC242_47 TaxID=3374626 RepID=UPI0037BA08D1
MEKFLQSLANLLPTGFAWPRDPRSTLMRVIRGVAASFNEHHEVVAETVRQWQPATTVNRMAEWEESTGLPDACFGLDQPLALRRKLLLARLRPVELFYGDSSPAATGSIEAICAWLGYKATVRYNTPFRVGRNRVGERLGALNGRLWITVTLETAPFRVGVNRVGDRLRIGTLNGGELACYLQRIVHARYEVNVIFI